MGRDPVELAKRARYQLPAMCAGAWCKLYKKSPFRYNEVVQAEIITERRLLERNMVCIHIPCLA